MWVNLAYYFLIINALLVFKLAWDFYAANIEHRVINHKKSAAIDTIIYIIAAILLTNNILAAAGLVIFSLGYRGLLFDTLFNILNRHSVFYCGNSAKLDLLFDRLDGFKDNSCLLGAGIKTTLIIIGLSIIWIVTR